MLLVSNIIVTMCYGHFGVQFKEACRHKVMKFIWINSDEFSIVPPIWSQCTLLKIDVGGPSSDLKWHNANFQMLVALFYFVYIWDKSTIICWELFISSFACLHLVELWSPYPTGKQCWLQYISLVIVFSSMSMRSNVVIVRSHRCVTPVSYQWFEKWFFVCIP